MTDDQQPGSHVPLPVSTALPRDEARALEAALAIAVQKDSRLLGTLPHLEYVGGATDDAWVSLRNVSKANIYSVRKAVVEIAKAVLGRDVSENLVALVPSIGTERGGPAIG